ncbi:MAG: hypothetical protein KAR20_11000 [Candidatus Heimdallarchaeota archaeon]|nr:hypothetical protein [Candidatus Heimdallarchaeota archaeon]
MARIEEGRLQKGGNNGVPVNPPPLSLRPEPPQEPPSPQTPPSSTDPQSQNNPDRDDR